MTSIDVFKARLNGTHTYSIVQKPPKVAIGYEQSILIIHASQLGQQEV
jgi:hypothetical protein